MKYVVVDVYALAYRALYGYPELTNKKGEPTQVIVGFFKQFYSRVKTPEQYYPIFVADSAGSNYRKEMLTDYKQNRDKQNDKFYKQIDFILKICAQIGTVYREPGYEADDLAACFIKQYVTEDDECLLITGDMDWLQMLSRNVAVLQLKPNYVNTLWTDELFFKEYGFTPKQIIDYKALCGDKSDNIPGVKGVGDKQAKELIKEFGTVENIYKNIVKVFNTRNLQTNLIENEGIALLNKKLVTLNTDITPLAKPDITLTKERISEIISEFKEYTDAEAVSDMLEVYLEYRL